MGAVRLMTTMQDFNRSLKDLKLRGLPVAAMADMLFADRKAVYGWLEGESSNQQAETRLASIRNITDPVFDENYKTMHRLWRTKDRTGVTLGDLLTADTIDLDAVERYLEVFASAIRRYARQDAVAAPSRPGMEIRNPIIDDWPTVDFGDR